MTDEELIARLRDDKLTWGDRWEAADRIDALTKQVREMAMQSLSDLGQAQDAYAELVAERTKVAKLVEALELWDNTICHQYSGSRDAMSDMTYAMQTGYAALAEIKKDKNDD